MAIEKIIFQGETRSDQYEEMLAFCQEYVSRYLPNIIGDESTGEIKCRLPDRNYNSLLLKASSNQNIAVTKWYSGNSGTSTNGNTYDGSGQRYDHAIVTSKGIYLCWYKDATKTNEPSFVILTPNNTGGVFSIGSYNASACHCSVGDLTNRHAFGYNIFTQVSASTGFSYMSHKAAFTNLTPFIDRGTYNNGPVSYSYTPYCFWLFFNEFFGQIGKLTLNGKSYFTNGYIAIEE